jgi:hypothetical protein
VTDEFWIQAIRSAPSHWLATRVEVYRSFIRDADALVETGPEITRIKKMAGFLGIDVRLMADELARRGVKHG